MRLVKTSVKIEKVMFFIKNSLKIDQKLINKKQMATKYMSSNAPDHTIYCGVEGLF